MTTPAVVSASRPALPAWRWRRPARPRARVREQRQGGRLRTIESPQSPARKPWLP